MPPLFSVVIPAYNQAEFLDEAIRSILDQTVQDFEILVVNDASTDSTAEIMSRYDDPRIIVLTHPQNRGLPAARNTGMAAARGEFIALLDADDYYHPHKFEAHLRFLRAHPEISVTYNARFELHHSSKKVRDIYRPPATAELKDFVLGFPFSPSDMVIRREAAERIHFFDENMRCGGEDLDFPCRLALEGNRFARVSGVLNYRRFHAGRKKKKLRCRFGDYTRALDLAFKDPRCSAGVIALRKQACANHYTEVACWALAQGETELGNEIIQEILILNPEAGSGNPSRLASALFNYAIRDESIDHEKVLPDLYRCLPPALAVPPGETAKLVARGYLLKGTRSALWGDSAAAEKYFARAAALRAEADASYRMMVAAQLAVYEAELGPEAAASMARQLFARLNGYYGPACARQIQGYLASDQAFTSYRQGDYSTTLRAVSQAIANDPRYLSNRGILSITARSLWKSVKHRLL
jgi:glycosyltransferase involved in cell wall biosynthesis